MAKKKIQKYKILDLFVWWEDEKQNGTLWIEATKKGKKFLDKHKKVDPNFDEHKYLQDFFHQALKSFFDSSPHATDTKTSD